MEQISELQTEYFQLRFFYGSGEPCVSWAVERLRNDQEGDDLEIVLLAGARGREEVLALVDVILDRYLGVDRLDEQSLAGKHIVELRQAYLNGLETISSLDEKFSRLYAKLDYPNWLVMLSRNCEYATDIPNFVEPFEEEFKYISTLWGTVKNIVEFEAQYRREISNSHDLKNG